MDWHASHIFSDHHLQIGPDVLLCWAAQVTAEAINAFDGKGILALKIWTSNHFSSRRGWDV